MADLEKYGTHWQDYELDATVEDYFSMLAADIAGLSYVKSKHSAALMSKIGRSHRSVEFKHQNISAVLETLGLPWIPGYRPKKNYQIAIFDAIDRYLSSHNAEFAVPTAQPVPRDSMSTVFVAPPPPIQTPRETPARLQRLVRKFDPVERDHRNRTLGKAGEEFAFRIERRRLEEANRADLARRVRWIANEDGDGAGYDILSFSQNGDERLIEVKTTNGAAQTPFFLTRNECDIATERPMNWMIYRVHMYVSRPRIFTISPPLETILILRPETWRASFC